MMKGKDNKRKVVLGIIFAIAMIILGNPSIAFAKQKIPEVTVYIHNAKSVYGEPMVTKFNFHYKVTNDTDIKKADLKKMITFKKEAGEDAGKYKITGSVKKSAKGKVKVKFVPGTYTIKKATYDMSGITFEDRTETYNGEFYGIGIKGMLPEGVEVLYKNNVGINAGVYNAVAIFIGDSKNYKEIPKKYATLTIEKATYDMSHVRFFSRTFYYDGNPHSVEISGQLPKGVTVTYEGNIATEPGTYYAVAKFSGDFQNYNPIPDMKATLVIMSNQSQDPTPDPEPNPTPDPEPNPTPDPEPDPTPDPEPDPIPDPDDENDMNLPSGDEGGVSGSTPTGDPEDDDDMNLPSGDEGGVSGSTPTSDLEDDDDMNLPSGEGGGVSGSTPTT